MTRVVCLAVWAAIGASLVGCELFAVLTRGRTAGAGRVLKTMTNGRIQTLLLFVGWMWLGWHFFAR